VKDNLRRMKESREQLSRGDPKKAELNMPPFQGAEASSSESRPYPKQEESWSAPPKDPPLSYHCSPIQKHQLIVEQLDSPEPGEPK
jgi:hypothetical protein